MIKKKKTKTSYIGLFKQFVELISKDIGKIWIELKEIMLVGLVFILFSGILVLSVKISGWFICIYLLPLIILMRHHRKERILKKEIDIHVRV